jgi:AmmeMemoRadiSam system protein A
LNDKRQSEILLDPEERRNLLKVATDALNDFVKTGEKPDLKRITDRGRRAAAFVTLRRASRLRGCLGNLSVDRPLTHIVAECVVAAASEDPRFSAVTEDEIPELEITISVLGSFQEVKSPEEIVIGNHGLLISKGQSRGLLLPQVATELGLDAVGFLELTCEKAFLPRQAWRHEAEIQVFTAEVFSSKP